MPGESQITARHVWEAAPQLTPARQWDVSVDELICGGGERRLRRPRHLTCAETAKRFEEARYARILPLSLSVRWRHAFDGGRTAWIDGSRDLSSSR